VFCVPIGEELSLWWVLGPAYILQYKVRINDPPLLYPTPHILQPLLIAK